MAKILIVDDRPVNRQFLTTLLAYKHHELLESSDGVDALNLARKEHPDLIVSDVLMPTMDGYEFVRQLRADRDIANIPVVFSTAHYLSRESEALAQQCGIDSIIYKPCEPQEVLEIVDHALSHQPKLSAPADPEEFRREHLQLLTNKLSEKTDEVRSVNQKLKALFELNTQLSTSPDQHLLLRSYCEAAREVIGARWAALAMFEKDHASPKEFYSCGLDHTSEELLTKSLSKTRLFANLLHATKPVRIAALEGFREFEEFSHVSTFLNHAELTSFLGLPLLAQSGSYGWLCLAGKLGGSEFSLNDEQMGVILTRQLAVTYENSLLFELQRHQVTRLENEIGKREEAERVRSETEAKLSSIVATAMDAIVAVNEFQRVVIFNAAAEKMFGCKAGDAIGKSLDHFIPALLRNAHREHVNAFGRARVTTRSMNKLGAVRGINSAGSEFPIEASISQVEVGGKKLFTAILRDVSERQHAEKVLRESEQELRLLHLATNDMIWNWDLVTGKVVRSIRFKTGFGYLESEIQPVIGWWEDRLHPDDRERVLNTFQSAVNGGDNNCAYEYQFRQADGSYAVVSDRAYLVRDERGRVARALGAMTDITQRKQAEEALKETNQDLEQTVAALREKTNEIAAMTQQLWQASKLATMGELSASIAHELNNPLATVALRAETLLAQLSDDNPGRHSLEVMVKEVDRMARLVNNLLQFGRRSSRQVSTVNLNAEIEDSIELVNYHVSSHGIEIQIELCDPLPAVQADRQQLRQLFLNLLTNAADAMPNGGRLAVRTTRLNLDGKDAVLIGVIDNGEGIARENLEHIWSPFFTTKPEGKGTGLGLAICRRIVEEHGGTIGVESNPGHGTSVSVTFPAIEAELRSDK